MSDYRTVLERARREFPAPDMELDAIVRRRRRREVKRRLGTAVLALGLVAAAFAGIIRALSPAAPIPGEEPKPLLPCTAFEQACGWIAYNDGTGIWAVDPRKAYPGTFSPTRFPDDTVLLAGPSAGDPIAWSADGSRLLVRSPNYAFIDGRQGLFVLDPDGTETRVAPDSVSGFYGASISPDGTQVVYPVGFDGSRLEVATVGEGSAPVVLRSSDVTLHRPAFSPDGGRIAYIEGSYDHSNGLWVMNADGSNPRQVAGGDWGHVGTLVWSPDGERLAMTCHCDDTGGVYTIRPDGSGLTLVSADGDGDGPVPQWSPDGSQIAWVHQDIDVITPRRTTTATLIVVRAEGGEERELVHLELALLEGQNPRWLTIAWNPAG